MTARRVLRVFVAVVGPLAGALGSWATGMFLFFLILPSLGLLENDTFLRDMAAFAAGMGVTWACVPALSTWLALRRRRGGGAIALAVWMTWAGVGGACWFSAMGLVVQALLGLGAVTALIVGALAWRSA
ncbi:MAG: hypothetical protein H6739_37580 [Alphaproteobacteria bacterium]|nr:hypothetical protein [Alphaproteobacteria bacterium]